MRTFNFIRSGKRTTNSEDATFRMVAGDDATLRGRNSYIATFEVDGVEVRAKVELFTKGTTAPSEGQGFTLTIDGLAGGYAHVATPTSTGGASAVDRIHAQESEAIAMGLEAGALPVVVAALTARFTRTNIDLTPAMITSLAKSQMAAHKAATA